MSLERAIQRADETRDEALGTLRKLVAQPSVSASGEGVRETASLLREVMEDAGIGTRTLDAPGHPVIYGEVEGPPGAPTVLFYGHYDVQPPEPLDLWDSPPFEPAVRDGRIYGRGVADNKGQHLCHVWAVRAWREAVGDLPVTVKFLIEGEEETGSPHLASVVREHRDLLRADVVCTADGGMHPSGRPLVCFGARGLLYVEVEVRGAVDDAHSGNKGNVLPQPAWELVDLLSSLRRDGRAAFPGFHDHVRPPSAEEEAMLRRIPFDREQFLAEHGLEDSPVENGADYYRRLAFEPTFNVAGLASGYGGEGQKTIIPARATAKIDLRLVADQDPEAVFEAFSSAVAERNPRAEVRRLSAVPPSRTDPTLPISRSMVAAAGASWGVDAVVAPVLGGTLPDYVFTQLLGAPSVVVPYANHDEYNHAPNENLRLECFFNGIRTTLHIFDTL